MTKGGYWLQRWIILLQRKDIDYRVVILVTEGGNWLQRGKIGYRGGGEIGDRGGILVTERGY